MQVLTTEDDWVEATYAIGTGSRKEPALIFAIHVVGQGGFVVRFEDETEAEAFAEALKRAVTPKKGQKR